MFGMEIPPPSPIAYVSRQLEKMAFDRGCSIGKDFANMIIVEPGGKETNVPIMEIERFFIEDDYAGLNKYWQGFLPPDPQMCDDEEHF